MSHTPLSDSWSCGTCLLSNKSSDSLCVACQSPNPKKSSNSTNEVRHCSNLHFNLIVKSSQRIVLVLVRDNEPSRVSPCHEVFVPQLLTLFHQIVAVKTEPVEAAEVKPALGGLFTAGTGCYYNLSVWRSQKFEPKQAIEWISMFLPQNIQFLLNLDTILAGKLILEQALPAFATAW